MADRLSEITPAMLAAARTVWLIVDGKEVRLPPETAALAYVVMEAARVSGSASTPPGRR